jgi:alkanesulfonate monooxygenase SsuD/methylene tetrahydromethanopterin reductase-like flavin-dependent oxidoreductase (luciferase family)
MKALWKDEVASFQGKYFSFPDLHTGPLPVQKPHPPIIFGGESLPALKRIADLGDGWQPGAISLDAFQEKTETLKALMKERGRDFSELSISMLGDAEDLKKNRDKIAAFEKLGVSEIVLFMAGPDVNATLNAVESAAKALIV